MLNVQLVVYKFSEPLCEGTNRSDRCCSTKRDGQIHQGFQSLLTLLSGQKRVCERQYTSRGLKCFRVSDPERGNKEDEATHTVRYPPHPESARAVALSTNIFTICSKLSLLIGQLMLALGEDVINIISPSHFLDLTLGMCGGG